MRAYREARRLWKKRHAKKNRVHTLVWRACRDGRLARARACACGCPNVEAHHEDYDRPLDVIWLCRACHMRLHRARRMEGKEMAMEIAS